MDWQKVIEALDMRAISVQIAAENEKDQQLSLLALILIALRDALSAGLSEE